jgi:hypothetical protein
MTVLRHTHTHTHIHIYMYIYVCVYIYICINICNSEVEFMNYVLNSLAFAVYVDPHKAGQPLRFVLSTWPFSVHLNLINV